MSYESIDIRNRHLLRYKLSYSFIKKFIVSARVWFNPTFAIRLHMVQACCCWSFSSLLSFVVFIYILKINVTLRIMMSSLKSQHLLWEAQQRIEKIASFNSCGVNAFLGRCVTDQLRGQKQLDRHKVYF